MSKSFARRAKWGLAVAALALTASCSQSGSDGAESNSQKTVTSTAEIASSPFVNDCIANNPVTRPGRMLLACGDGGLSVQSITWSTWGPDTAEGEGTQYRRICEPNCAAGHEATAPTHITLRKVSKGYFTEAVITDLNGKPETWPIAPLR
ncbi:hypothetical protein AB0N05_26145 [Nocardia sp. NPDC051030]|uniref:hypothetical protein n=1 Tax=Nocardia sp. NPDC051030 TaxID=3155162 RepID=UPI00343B61AE